MNEMFITRKGTITTRSTTSIISRGSVHKKTNEFKFSNEKSEETKKLTSHLKLHTTTVFQVPEQALLIPNRELIIKSLQN
jgi:hypothetical protein